MTTRIQRTAVMQGLMQSVFVLVIGGLLRFLFLQAWVIHDGRVVAASAAAKQKPLPSSTKPTSPRKASRSRSKSPRKQRTISSANFVPITKSAAPSAVTRSKKIMKSQTPTRRRNVRELEDACEVPSMPSGAGKGRRRSKIVGRLYESPLLATDIPPTPPGKYNLRRSRSTSRKQG